VPSAAEERGCALEQEPAAWRAASDQAQSRALSLGEFDHEKKTAYDLPCNGYVLWLALTSAALTYLFCYLSAMKGAEAAHHTLSATRP